METNNNQGCAAQLLLIVFFIIFAIGYCSTRTGLDGVFYRFHPDTKTTDLDEYVLFDGDRFQWYINGEKTKDFKYDVYGGTRIKVEFGIQTLSFSMSEDKNVVTIDGKEFRKQTK
jgi:hypothetical protein